MPVEVLAARSAHGRARIGMSGGDLDIAVSPSVLCVSALRLPTGDSGGNEISFDGAPLGWPAVLTAAAERVSGLICLSG